MITPVLFSKALTATAPFERDEVCVNNPFPYVELYNPSPVELDLGRYVIRLRNRYGGAPLPERSLPLKGCRIGAGKTLTVWVKPFVLE